MNRAAIHFRDQIHMVAKSIYRNCTSKIYKIIAEQISKTLTTTNFVIALSASKDFLMNYLFHHGEGKKVMLKGKEMEEVMDCF